MKEEIKELRVRLDGLAQLTKELKPYLQEGIGLMESIRIHSQGTTKEIEKAYDSLILAKAWLGKVLGELGESTPYANDGLRKLVEDIEPTADKATLSHGLNKNTQEGLANGDFKFSDVVNEEVFKHKNHIEKVDWLREEIGKLVDIERFDSQLPAKARTYLIWSFKYLSEARFWLGFELQRIRENGQA